MPPHSEIFKWAGQRGILFGNVGRIAALDFGQRRAGANGAQRTARPFRPFIIKVTPAISA